MTREDFYELPLLSTFFPLTFAHTNVKWTKMTPKCNFCERSIHDEEVRGTVRGSAAGYRSSPTRYEIDGVGWCRDCDGFTTFCYTLCDDMTMTGIHPITHEFTTWKAERVSQGFVKKFVSWLKSVRKG